MSFWSYFVKLSSHGAARCVLCNKIYSYKSTVTNLKTHLCHKHKSVYEKLQTRRLMNKEDTGTSSKRNVSAEDDDSNSSLQQQDVYFEECDGQINCTICKKNISEDGENPRGHLEEHHPGLLARIIKNEDKAEEATTLQENNDADQDIFTEVVYLDPFPESRTSNKRQKHFENPPISPKKRRVSTSHDFQIKSMETTSEIDSFLGYITILLKKLPSDVCSRVQLEIINLIMKAQFQQSSNSAQPQVNPDATVTNASNELDACNVQNFT